MYVEAVEKSDDADSSEDDGDNADECEDTGDADEPKDKDASQGK
jgi:hypothetical protein